MSKEYVKQARSITNQSKAEFYCSVATNLDAYFTYKTLEGLGVNIENQKSIGRFFLRNHRLAIETGAWKRPKTPRNRRKCLSCDCIEDEIHLLFYCSKATENRTRYLKFIQMPEYRDLSPTDALVTLFQSSDKKLFNNLGIFARKST